jgi:hypothetical protein
MDSRCFTHLSGQRVADAIHAARVRVVFAAPGLQQPVAAALVNVRRELGRTAVRVILDVTDTTARMGYGDIDSVEMLKEGDVDVRTEAGLRTCILICDDEGFAFFTPPLLVETSDDQHVGANALQLHSEQTRTMLAALCPQATSLQPASVPELGQQVLTASQVQHVKSALDANPPQKFDLARKVNVFNAFIEFIDLRLTGLHIARHTVQLPKDLVLATRDDATASRLLTTFKLVSDDSKVAKEAGEIDRRVRSLREKYTRSLGESLGNVILRSKRQALVKEVDAINLAIVEFKQKVVERLDKELEASKKKLVEGLLPAVKAAPPQALTAQLSGKPTVDILRKYLDHELGRVFPSAASLVGEMKLELVTKGVTYQMLSSVDFQKRVRESFPYEDWDKPFQEFSAAPAGETQSLFS